MITRQQKRKASYTALVFIAMVVGFGRWFLEANLGVAKVGGILPFAYTFYYLAVSLSFHLVLRQIAGLSGRFSLNSARLGLLVGLLPPVIDGLNTWLTNAPLLHYSYYLYEDLSHFSPVFYAPTHGFPLGESVAVWIIILMTFVLAIRQTRNLWRILATVVAAYAIFQFFLVFLPKGIADLFTRADLALNLDAKLRLNSRNATTQYHVFAHFAIILLLLVGLSADFRRALIKRFFHYLPFGAIAAMPFVFTANFGVTAFIVPALVMVNFLFACMQNDLYDFNPGNRTNTERLNSRRSELADIVYFFMGLLFIFIAYLYGLGNLLFFPQLIFLVLTLLYNLPETRMRYYILGGQKVEGGWGVCALWSALVCQNINPFQSSTLILTILVFFGWAYLSSIKDIKDILSDRRDGRATLISFLHKKLGSLSRAVKFYKIQISIILCLPLFLLMARKPILSTALFFLLAIIPIWVVLIRVPSRRLFPYFSFLISIYFIAFGYAAGY